MFPSLYHAHHSRHQEDLPFWLQLAAVAVNPVLELGCGTGRVLIPLSEAGHHVVGLDHDHSMLVFLRATLPPGLQPAPLLLAADLTRFNLAAEFPLVILPCNTYSTLNASQRKASLECIRRHLAEGGIFAASLPNPHYLIALPPSEEAELEDEFIHPLTHNPVQVSSAWKRSRHTFTLSWLYDHLLPDGTVQRHAVGTTHHLVSTATYLEEIHSAGLVMTALFGDFDQSAYSENSPHLIILASKQPY